MMRRDSTELSPLSRETSPNQPYRAFATEFVDVSFWGRTTWFYVFEVEECDTGRTLAKHQTPPMAHQETDQFCTEVCIRWTPDVQRVQVELRDQLLWQSEFDRAA